MSYDPDPDDPPRSPFGDRTVMTIAQRLGGAPWRLGLAHSRDTHLLIWVTRGTGRAMVEARAMPLGAHNALFVPAGTLFSASFDTICFGQTLSVPADAGLAWPEAPALVRVREPKAQLTMTGFIEAIQSEATAGAALADAAIAAHVQLMVVWAARYGAGEQRSDDTAAQRLMRAYCALIAARPAAPMAEFAAQLGVTPTHLSRVCKAECGLTAADLLTQVTLGRARRALQDGAAPAVRIAEELGFSSAAYFTRFIKAHTGLTPSDLRAVAQRSATHSA